MVEMDKLLPLQSTRPAALGRGQYCRAEAVKFKLIKLTRN